MPGVRSISVPELLTTFVEPIPGGLTSRLLAASSPLLDHSRVLPWMWKRTSPAMSKTVACPPSSQVARCPSGDPVTTPPSHVWTRVARAEGTSTW